MSRRRTRTLLAAALPALTVTSLVTACGSGGSTPAASGGSGGSGGGEAATIALWSHAGGGKEELAAYQKIIDGFNASQTQYKVAMQSFPQESYNAAVTAAASANKLPCVLDIDAPNVPNWVWAGYLAPIDMPASDFEKQLKSTVGMFDDKVYSYGYFEAALGMYVRKSTLTAAGVRIPTIAQPWTKDEFDQGLAKLKAGGKHTWAVDMASAAADEWVTYAYSPMLQSFGADLINRSDYKSATGTLNNDKAIAWAQWFRGLVTSGYMPQKSGADATQDFINGKSAILYQGSWAANTIAKSKIAADVVTVPVPDLGNGPKIGGGSWQWGMTEGCANKEGALAYLKYAHGTEHFVNVSKALGLIPATDEAAAQLPEFAANGKYRIWYDMSNKYALVRPVTAAYPFVTTTFRKAATDILAGGDPKTILDKAASDIDSNLKQNNYYQ